MKRRDAYEHTLSHMHLNSIFKGLPKRVFITEILGQKQMCKGFTSFLKKLALE